MVTNAASDDMLGDGWCDLNCLNSNITICNDYEYENDCSSCSDGNNGCQTPLYFFQLIAGDDNLVNEEEICANPTTIIVINSLLDEEMQIENCHNVTNNELFDVN